MDGGAWWAADMTERLHFHFSLSCIGEGNGNPLQCSCLENPRDGGAWWAAVCGVAQSRTWLKQLSSSSSSSNHHLSTELFSLPKLKLCVHYTVTPQSSFLVFGNHLFTFVSLNLIALDT